jgi:hypothetical protein
MVVACPGSSSSSTGALWTRSRTPWGWARRRETGTKVPDMAKAKLLVMIKEKVVMSKRDMINPGREA